MINQLIIVFSAIIASCIIMIVHELPKSIAYAFINKKQPGIKKYIFKVNQYIDPIGLIFSITCYAGFSKPYMYRIKDKKTNLILGIIGFSSLILCFIVSIVIIKFFYAPDVNTIYEGQNILMYIEFFKFEFMVHMAWLSMSMIIVNLFPVSTFDISLIIAAKSPSRYFSLIQEDHIVKIALVLAMVFGIINTISRFIFQYFI